MPSAEFLTEVQSRLGDRFLGQEPIPQTLGRIRFRPESALEVFHLFHDELGFGHLSMVGGIDWTETREIFYVLWSDPRRQYVILSASVPAGDPRIESASGIWPSANWHEREAWEMVDIQFEHHPDMRHLLMPDGYEFRPLLRSFKLHEPEELEVKRRGV